MTTQIDLSRQARFTTGNLSLNSNKFTNSADPTSAQDLATKTYVDSIATGLSNYKTSCRVASTANVNKSSAPASIDGTTLSSGDRILLKDQSTGSENGIYVFNGTSSALTRSTDANTSADVTSGTFIFVDEGTANVSTGWVLSTPNAIVLDTTSLTFVKFSAVGLNATSLAGNGLSASGTQLVVNPADSTINVASGGIKVGSGTITNTHVATGAAIALSKLATGTSAQIIVANVSGVPAYVSSSGDVTVDNTGAFTIGSAKVKASQLDRRKETRAGSTSATWGLSATPANSTTHLDVYLNGQMLDLTTDFSLSGSTITFVDSIVSTDIVKAIYWV